MIKASRTMLPMLKTIADAALEARDKFDEHEKVHLTLVAFRVDDEGMIVETSFISTLKSEAEVKEQLQHWIDQPTPEVM